MPCRPQSPGVSRMPKRWRLSPPPPPPGGVPSPSLHSVDVSSLDHSNAGSNGVRAIALYLPQFHPVPENSEWWGPGFTEWTNTARARPLFPGHRQPHIPGQLGFCDLRLAETRQDQADLARAYGIEGFCYYHYWFGHGRRILERPITEVIESGEPNFPFCLAWANGTWSRTWDNRPGSILVEQRYPGDDDIRAHFDAVLPALSDPRALRIDGRAVFVVYAPNNLEGSARFVELWRDLAQQNGLPGLYLIGRTKGAWTPSEHGFDAALTAQVVPPFASRLAADRWARLRPDWLWGALTRRLPITPAMYSFRRWSPHIPWLLDQPEQSFPTVLSGWDNTPRMGRRGAVYMGARPALFEEQVRHAVGLISDRPADQRVLFVQAWNEWAEGNHLEPDLRYGDGWLEALRRGLGVVGVGGTV